MSGAAMEPEEQRSSASTAQAQPTSGYNKAELDAIGTGGGFETSELDAKGVKGGFNKSELDAIGSAPKVAKSELDAIGTAPKVAKSELDAIGSAPKVAKSELDAIGTAPKFDKSELDAIGTPSSSAPKFGKSDLDAIGTAGNAPSQPSASPSPAPRAQMNSAPSDYVRQEIDYTVKNKPNFQSMAVLVAVILICIAFFVARIASQNAASTPSSAVSHP
jgi:hypothetical protein